MLTMIGTCIGSGQLARAKSIAMIGTILSAAFTGCLDLIVAVDPTLWLGIFSDDLAVIQDGSAYLQVAGLSYPAMAVAFVLSFVSQGSGRPGWTTFAGTVRLGIAAGIGWLAVAHWGADLRALSAIVTLSQVAAAGICLWVACCGHIWPQMGRPAPPPGSREIGA